jgi:hypothetical protein
MHKIAWLLHIVQYGLPKKSVDSFAVNIHRYDPKTKSIVPLHESANTIGNNPLRVDRVTICMGELCKCQEENADMIMESLTSTGDLPFQIEDSPCLGACGVGAMVSVEYEDGSYNLVTGLQETLEATGLSGTIGLRENTISEDISSPNESDSMNQDDKMSSNQINSNYMETRAHVPNSDEATTDKVNDELCSVRDEDDVGHEAVKRMREEARESKDEVLNPWINMALYLFNKARSS